MKTRTGIVAMVAFGAILSGWTSPASAQSVISDPFGNNATLAVIGRDTSNNDELIVWYEYNTANCSVSYLGNGGWSSDYEVRLLGGDDGLRTPSSWSICGYTLSTSTTNGHYMRISGGDGNDYTWSIYEGDISGGAGDDVVLSLYGGVTYLTGDDGNDTVVFAGSGSGQFLAGGNGNDCVAAPSGAPWFMGCGPGTDSWQGPGTMPGDCESAATANCGLW